MSTANKPYTANDLYAKRDDGFRYELVRGELRKMTPAGHRHGRVAMNFGERLAAHVRSHRLGAVYAAETGFKLASAPDVVRAPDAAFIRRERIDAIGDIEGYWPGAPDLVAEVVSPNDTYAEIEAKVFDWLDAGARQVVVLNPVTRSATVYHSRQHIVVLTEADALDGGDVVPGFRLAVSEIFE